MKKIQILFMGILAISGMVMQDGTRTLAARSVSELKDYQAGQEICLEQKLSEEIEILVSDEQNTPEGTQNLSDTETPSDAEKPSEPEESSKTALSSCDIPNLQPVEYKGKAEKPEILVKNGEEVLLQGKDYELAYENNTGPGTAKVTITGIGDYEGTVSRTFKIILAKPKLKSVAARTYNSLKISWSKVPGAQGYYIYQKSGEVWKRIGSSSGTSFVAGSSKYPVETGVTYTYTVRGYYSKDGSLVCGGYDEKGKSGKTIPKQPVLVEAKSVAENKIEIRWKKAAGATNYLLYRKNTKGEWQFLKNVKEADTVQYTHVSSTKFPIVKGKNYVYTVCSYTTAGKTRGTYDKKGLKVKALSSVEIINQQALDNAREVVKKVTNSSMTNAQKLQACYNWVISKPYVLRRRFSNFPGWPAVFANDHFVLGGGSCHADAGAFAYLAKALGYKNVYVCTDAKGTRGEGHSWTEINGLVYDPLFSEAKNYSRYYGATYATYILRPILHIAI